ncbi:AMP-binding protein [Streptomyces netropsis]|uniref:AMP-binding protein n=1 Tax=Streptomyces netropsis TaxID=55404 RepID=UPI0030CE4212
MTHVSDHRSPSPTAARQSPEHTVPALIEATAALCPDAVAMVRGNRACSYRELVECYQATARGLRAAGVGDGDVVAVRGGRSVETVVSLLGVLRAGAVLTMIDVTQPAGRVRDVLAAARPRLVLDTTGEAAPAELADHTVLHPDDLTDQPVGLPEPDIEAPAYLCFTSGTTGTPRGVLGWHGALTQFCAWEQQALAITDGDRVAQMAALTFDALFKDLFPTLIGGATICLPPTDRPFVDVTRVLEWLRADAVTVLQTVPSVLASLLSELPEGLGFPALRLICLSGEPLAGSLVNRWRTATDAPQLRFVNLYGTTEATILKAWYPVPQGEVPAGTLPVGTATDGAELLVVNRRGRRCGVGEPGQVLIRSRYLTRGLWRPERDAKPLFDVNPLNPDDPTDLVQRTGDLGRIDPQGNVEIQGRADDQVKILGVRVQPTEVAAVIRRLPEVKDAAVVVRPGGDGPTLAAYLVPAPGVSLDATSVRAHVAAHGSNAMVPAHVVLLERMPLTGHGKLDRAALPEPEQAQPSTEVAADEGEWSDTEQRVAAIWSEVLRQQVVSRHANFFHLGGHSLVMARVLARIRRAFAVELSLTTLFRSATVAALAAAVDEALGAEGTAVEEPLPLPAAADAQHPLSPEQEGLWYLQQLDPSSSAYNMVGVFTLPARMDEEAVHEAVRTVCGRHQALRLRFREVDGRPVQLAGPAEVDFDRLPTSADRAAGVTALTTAAAVPFDLVAGPPVRVRTVRVAERELLVGLTIHHLCCDAVSWRMICEQVDELLIGTDRHAHLDSAEPRLQFGDWAAWRSGRTTGARAEADLAYWRDLLADVRRPDLPLGRPVPGEWPHQARVARLPLAPELGAPLAEFCARADATEYMAMMTVLSYALSRAAAQDQVVVGSDSVGRDREEFDEVVGFFVRTHAYAFDLSGDPSFAEALERVRATLIEAAGHRDISYAQVVDAVTTARGGDRDPLFSVLLRMPPREELPGKAAVLHPVDVVAEAADGTGAAPTAKFDLTVVVRPEPTGTVLDLEYDADTVQPEYVAALAERLGRLLRFAAEQPTRPLSLAHGPAHPFDTELPPAPLTPVAERVHRQAAATPEAVAVRWAQGEVTYRQLAYASTSVSRELEPGERVGLLGGKTPATVAALVGALAASAVPVPMDEGLPGPRLETMAAKAGASRVLCTEPSTAADALTGVKVHRLTFDGLVAGAESDAPAPAGPDDPAYVFFTSGTTGEAKAVLGRRRGLDHFIDWETAEFGVHPGDRVAQLTTLSFDAMLRDVFVPLTRGATLCLPSAADLDDTARTVEWLARERITIVHTTPSVVTAWLREADPATARLPHLRLLCLSGEPLTGRLVARLREHLLGPDTEIVNFYGPTETTMIKTFHRVAPDHEPARPVPVGRALPGGQAVVLGAGDRPCGPGERGEIVLRTPYRTLGYLGNTGADSAFRPNPRATGPDDLVYRTGDLAVVGADGEIHIEGRRDDLLKVRGIRIHPGEVAAELATHSEVRQVHVDADKEGDGTLVAYVVKESGATLTAETLRAYARERMPLALVPGLFLFVDRFALLPNGKLDRSSLRCAAPRRTVERVEPRDESEQTLRQIWSDLLEHQDFGVTDDFFAVGGHSLLATILLTRVRKHTGVSLSLRQLIEGPRIEHLAAAVRESVGDAAEQTSEVLLPLRPGMPGGPLLFLVHPIGGDVLCYRELAEALPAEVTVLGVRAPGLESGPALRTVQEMAAAYLPEVRKAQPQGPYHFAAWSMGGTVAYEMARQLSFEGERTASVTLLDSYAPGSGAFARFADPDVDRVASFAHDLERMTGERVDAKLLRGASAADEETRSLQRRYQVFDANATALVAYRLRRARLRDTRFTLVRAGAQERPGGATATLGWAEALGTDVGTATVPDVDHFTLLRGPSARIVAEEIARVIAASSGRPDKEYA